MKNNILHSNYTPIYGGRQVSISIDYEIKIHDNDPVVLLCEEMERLDYTQLYEAYSKDGRNPAISPKVMFMLLVFGYMNNIYSSRELVKACNYDVRFMYILNGENVPSHSSICRFRSKRLSGVIDDLFNQFVLRLKDKNEISGKNIFIDGTKIEAYANRYTFVWRKSVEKYKSKLFVKITELIEKVETELNISISENRSKLHMLNQLLNELNNLQETQGIEFVSGRGKRKTQLQRFIENATEYRSKLIEYNTHLKKMENRNSYSKTDNDATFMRMKEDHMRNGQLKPAYNVQVGADAGYVVGIDISQERSDMNTLIPFLSKLEKTLQYKYENVVADAGYDSEENLMHLFSQKQNAYIKPSTYEKSKTRRYKNDIGLAENMVYAEFGDFYICHAGNILYNEYEQNRRTKSGYIRRTSVYKCENCNGCQYKEKCIKQRNCNTPIEERTKTLYVSRIHTQLKAKAQKRITSEFGKQLRMNRSIQSEGFFGVLKEDKHFRRFMLRGTVKVDVEMQLLGLSFNILKYYYKIRSEKTQKHLYELKTA
jgi:transposase